jgi:alcohol dehydrogenase (cytochrome c)
MRRSAFLVMAGLLFAAQSLIAQQVTSARIVDSAREPQNWLTYNGTYDSQRYSSLKQIDLSNARNLELKWVYQTFSTWAFEPTPLVVNGVMYLTQGPNDVVALDAVTGRPFWIYRYTPNPDFKACCGAANRGVAVLGDTLFMGTIDAFLIAIDARSGREIWKTQVADTADGYAITHAPLVIKDKVLVGTAGGEYPTRGFIAAYDAHSGKEAWKFHTIPATGEPGNETWPAEAWKVGGGSVWLTGSYDPALNLTYWGVGNPNPDFDAAARRGDNLYTDSVVALDADTGKLKWHFQFTPNDPYDWDAVQTAVLVDMNWDGRARKLMLWANRNGFSYVLDRETGEFLKGYPLVEINWASGLDAKGRPVLTLPPVDKPVFPGIAGATSWYAPSFSPRTELFYVTIWEGYGNIVTPREQELVAGRTRMGGTTSSVIPGGPRPGLGGTLRGPFFTNGAETGGTGAVIAIDPRTGAKKWKFPMTNVSTSGILTTATDVLFTGSREGYFHALDARTGALLWKASVGGQVNAGPMTFERDGKQYVTIAAGTALFTFGLRE